MKVVFCGASKTVTGSCYYVESGNSKFLIDCGMFQGKAEKLNDMEFPFKPSDIDFVILTHAHIDHTGRVPVLVKNGFNGSIYCTSATADLLKLMLKDSGHIQETEAEWKNRKRMRKGLGPVDPLYTIEDAEKVSQYVQSVSYHQNVNINENISFVLRDAGHLLGSAFIEITVKEKDKTKKITFTGDLGNFNIPIIKDYEYLDETDYLVIESTYGNRYHDEKKETESLYDIILETTKKGGNVVIPSFAVGRTQELLYILNHYIDVEKRKELKNISFYLDSPLAQQATKIFAEHMECYNESALKELLKDNMPLDFDNLYYTITPEESSDINTKSGVVILSSSGMCDAGRIKHHLKHNLWRKESAIVFVGFQAEGTLGRRILDGEKMVQIFGEEIAVKAKIHEIPGLSGHADLYGLKNWIRNIKNGVSKTIFITHGDIEASENLVNELASISTTKCIIPDLFDEFIL